MKKLKAFYNKSMYIYALNAINILRYGFNAPRNHETIWVNPAFCKYFYRTAFLKNYFEVPKKLSFSGFVVQKDWPFDSAELLAGHPVVKNCVERYTNNLPWLHTGEYQRMLNIINRKGRSSHGCSTLEDITQRCENLDRIFEQAKKEKRLRIKKEIDSNKHWDNEEMFVHIGPDGTLYKGNEGMHRYAIASILEIPFPAQIGFVHEKAIDLIPKIREFRPDF